MNFPFFPIFVQQTQNASLDWTTIYQQQWRIQFLQGNMINYVGHTVRGCDEVMDREAVDRLEKVLVLHNIDGSVPGTSSVFRFLSLPRVNNKTYTGSNAKYHSSPKWHPGKLRRRRSRGRAGGFSVKSIDRRWRIIFMAAPPPGWWTLTTTAIDRFSSTSSFVTNPLTGSLLPSPAIDSSLLFQ